MAIARLVCEQGLHGIRNAPVPGAVVVIFLSISGVRNGKRVAIWQHPVIQRKVVDRAEQAHRWATNWDTNDSVQNTVIHKDGSINLYLETGGGVSDDYSLTASCDNHFVGIITGSEITVHSIDIELKFASTLQTKQINKYIDDC